MSIDSDPGSGYPRIVMGNSLSPKDAEEIARISGAKLIKYQYFAALEYSRNWMVSISHGLQSQGIHTSVISAYDLYDVQNSQMWTDSGIVISQDSVTLARLECPRGRFSLRTMTLENGRAAHGETDEPEQYWGEWVTRAAEQAYQTFPKLRRRG